MQRYSHSGIVPTTGAIQTLLAGVGFATVGGAIYAFAAYWLAGWGPIRFLLMLSYSLVVGVAVAVAANRGKIRSPLFNSAVALLSVAVGLWIYWGAYDVARNGLAVAPSAWTPAGLTRNASDLFVNGSFTMKRKQKVDGWLLVAFWIGEGVCVTGIAIALARSDANVPFCENCQEWTKSEQALLRLAASGAEREWQEVLAGDLPALAVFERAYTKTTPQVRLDLARCPKCEHSNFVSLTAVTITKDKKGNDKTKERSLIVNGAITDPEAVFLAEFAKQMTGMNEIDEDDDEEEEHGETGTGADAT